jgi:sugar lactone lactonase YvrE
MSMNPIPRPPLRIAAVLLSIAFALAACGGGGGGANGTGASAGVPAPAPIQVPAIVTQPAPQSATVGGAVTFAVGATGADLTYQWRRDGKDIAGATAAGYTLTSVQSADDGAVFTVAVKNGAGSVVSTGAALQVAVPKGLSLLAGQMGGIGNLDGQNGRLVYPTGVAVGPGGLLYLTDGAASTQGPGKLRTLDPATGTLATVRSFPAAVYPATSFPWRVAFDAAGNRYELTGSAIYKTTVAGVRSLLAGSDTFDSHAVDGVGDAARFYLATDLALDSAGNLYVTDANAATIRKIDPAGKVVTLAGDGITTSRDGRGNQASFWSPLRLAVDRAGNVFVVEASYEKGALRKVAPDGTVTTLTPKFADGTAVQLRQDVLISEIAVDAAGNLYVTDQHEGCRIVRIAPDGAATAIAGSATATGTADGKGDAARFCSATDRNIGNIVVDQAGDLIVLDSANGTVRRVTPTGEVTTVGGRAASGASLDGKGPAASFAFAQLPIPTRTRFTTGRYDLAADAQGNVYVGEGARIRKVSATGDTSTMTPAAGATAQAQYFARGMAYGGGALVVVDHVVSRVDANGTLHFLAGQPSGGRGRVDGKGAGARFANPYDLIADGLGNVYLRDVEYFGEIGAPGVVERKIAPDGTVTTLEPTTLYAPTPYGAVWHADRDGNVWTAYEDGQLVRMRPDGTRQTIRGPQADRGLRIVTALTRDAAGNLYVAETTPAGLDVAAEWHGVRRIAPDGTETLVAGTNGTAGVRLGAPGSLGRVDALTAGPDGIVYVMTENAVLKLKP